MFNYTKKSVYITSFAISIIIFIILLNFHNIKLNNINFNMKSLISKIEKNTYKNLEEKNNENNIVKANKYNWYIQISAINLVEPIVEENSKEETNKNLVHLKGTSIEFGNIGLIACSKGNTVKTFKNLKKLREGDEIIYKNQDFEMTYTIDIVKIIEETDWSYLEETEENKITLITSVENEPKYRRCIQATEKIKI